MVVRPKLNDQPDTDHNVRGLFQSRPAWTHRVVEGYEELRNRKGFYTAAIAIGLVLVLLIGFTVGGGFAGDAESAATGDSFITIDQAQELRQQAIDLRETESRLAISEGEAAFLRTQVDDLSQDVDVLQSSLDAAQLEMNIVVSIYEECFQRVHPADCVSAARSRADEVLAELYPAAP